MDKFKLNTIAMIITLLIGVFIGNNLPHKDNVISTTNKTKYQNSQIEFYDNMIQDVNTMEIYDTGKLTPDIMKNRNGKIIVEKIIGEVVDQNLNGRILNCDTNEGGYTNKDGGNYINYKRVDGAKEGDKIVTYFLYNPFTNAQDDVLTRMDFIIDDNAI